MRMSGNCDLMMKREPLVHNLKKLLVAIFEAGEQRIQSAAPALKHPAIECSQAAKSGGA